MKAYQFELKVVAPEPPLPGAEPDGIDRKPIRYIDLLETVLRAPAAQGVTKKEQKARNRVRRNLREANGTLLMSHEEYRKVKELADVYPWGLASFAVEQFCDDLDACPEVDVAPVEAGPTLPEAEAREAGS